MPTKGTKRKNGGRVAKLGKQAVSVNDSQMLVPGLPMPSGGELVRPQYNPSWNPQFLKVCREFQFSSPAADFGGGFGVIQDPGCGCLASNLSYTTGAISFRVSDVYNVTEFGSLFDQYRIAAVQLRFDYISSSESVLSTSNYQAQCTLLVYEDYDDSTAPAATNTGWQTLTESGRQKRDVFPNSRRNQMKYMLQPKYLALAVDNSAGTTGRSLSDDWLDGATSPDVVWRGLKWAIQANPGSTGYVHYFRVTAKYYLCFRNRQ